MKSWIFKFCSKKDFVPLIFFEKKSSLPNFFWKKVCAPLFFEKKSSLPFFFEKKSSPLVDGPDQINFNPFPYHCWGHFNSTRDLGSHHVIAAKVLKWEFWMNAKTFTTRKKRENPMNNYKSRIFFGKKYMNLCFSDTDLFKSWRECASRKRNAWHFWKKNIFFQFWLKWKTELFNLTIWKWEGLFLDKD